MIAHRVLSLAGIAVLAVGLYVFAATRRSSVLPRAGGPTQVAVAPTAARREPRDAPAGASTARRPLPEVAADAAPTPPRAGATATMLDGVIDQASAAYDHGELEQARMLADRALALSPAHPRALRIAIATSCVRGDGATARAHYAQLASGDRASSRLRCARYGVDLPDVP